MTAGVALAETGPTIGGPSCGSTRNAMALAASKPDAQSVDRPGWIDLRPFRRAD